MRQSQVLRGLFVPRKWIMHLVALITASAHSLHAAESTTGRGAGLPSDSLATTSLVQLMAGLILVLALIGVSAWVLRRFNRFQSAAGGQMKILGGLSMGTRERVVLVQVGKQQLLLGVAPGRVQTLHVLEEQLEETPLGGVHQGGGFAQRLQAAMRQRTQR